MIKFRNIDYGKMLFESLRAYFAVNSSGQLSILYKFCISCLFILQSPFNDYDTFRVKKFIIANCKYQIGQLTNVLNYFFDSVSKRIWIENSDITMVNSVVFGETPPDGDYDYLYGPDPMIDEIVFGGLLSRSNILIHVPSSVDRDELIAVIEQIKITGLQKYQII
jgi:hypothetical protein